MVTNPQNIQQLPYRVAIANFVEVAIGASLSPPRNVSAALTEQFESITAPGSAVE